MLASLGDVDLTLTTNGALLAKKARALRDAGPFARHRQPRRARRCDVPRDERRRLPGRARARRHRRRARGRPRAAQDQHGRQARRERARDRAAGAPFPRQRPHRALHRVHGRRPHQRLAHGRRRARRRDRARIDRAYAARAGRAQLPRRSRGALALSRRRRRDRRDRVGHAGVLPRLHARAAVDRRQALHLPVRRRRLRPARAAARPVRDAQIGNAIAAIWRERGDRYSEIRTAATPRESRIEMSYIGG